MELFGADLVQRLVAMLDGAQPPSFRRDVPVSVYTSAERWAAERTLFRRRPIVAAHSSALARIGDTVPVDVAGVPVVLVRGPDGRLRGFRNACRHRSTRLVADGEPSCKKAFVCPYHGWTYDLEGALIHVPHEQTFAGLDRSKLPLVAVDVRERHGLVWVGVDEPLPDDLGLGEMGSVLDELGLEDHRVFRRSTSIWQANWKFIIEAFLENYHIRQLHRHSVYPFFLDGVVVSDWVGPHMRAAVARRAIADHRDEPYESLDVRELLTANLFLFPNTILIVHPTYISRITIEPIATDRFGWTHELMIRRTDDVPEREAHFAKSWDLIDGQVFGQEDLPIVEQMQAGLAAQANEHLMFGAFEEAAGHLHDLLAEELCR